METFHSEKERELDCDAVQYFQKIYKKGLSKARPILWAYFEITLMLRKVRSQKNDGRALFTPNFKVTVAPTTKMSLYEKLM